jgi:hypothetical protein
MMRSVIVPAPEIFPPPGSAPDIEPPAGDIEDEPVMNDESRGKN